MKGLKVEGKKQVNHDFFGYLPCKWDIKFEGGSISPIQEFDQVSAVIDKYKDKEGFIYPEDAQQIRSDLSSLVPDMFTFEPPSPFFQYVYTSHVLCLRDTEVDIRKGSGAFLIYLLAYLFGVRLQFKGWWHDGRIPVKSTHNIRPTKKTAEKFLSHCYQLWKSWPATEQKLITNILYMHSRTPSYEWEWEQFTFGYMVVDGCWRLAKQQYNLPKGSHEERINVLCRKFGIPLNEALVKNIVELRNKLFHETLWDNSQPCTATNGPGFAASLHIRKLNQRLIPAILGYDTPYVRTPWWIMGTFSF